MRSRRDEIEVTLPTLTSVGEVFYSDSFGPNMLGQVVSIVDQIKGQTRVKIKVISKEQYEQQQQQTASTTLPTSTQSPTTQPLKPRSHRYPNRNQSTPTAIIAPQPPMAAVTPDPSLAQEILQKSNNLKFDENSFSTPAQRFQAGVEKMVQDSGNYHPPQDYSRNIVNRPGDWNPSSQQIAGLLPAAAKMLSGVEYGTSSHNVYDPTIGRTHNIPHTERSGGYRRSQYRGS